MDSILRSTSTCYSKCCAQVDVRASSLSLYILCSKKNLATRTSLNAFPSGARSSLTAQRASSRQSRASSKHTSSCAVTFSTSLLTFHIRFSQNDTNKLFEQYDVQKQVDVLHGVVTDARTQRRKGETPGANRWREDLQPREAVRARTTITLERERDLLRARLAQVGVTLSHVFAELKHLLCRWREKTWSCTVKYRSTRRHRSERKLVLRRSSHSSTR